MSHREDFSMTTFSGQLAMCDVCAGIIDNDAARLRTYIGATAQSDVCMDCAALIRKSAKPGRVTASGPLAVTA